MKPFLTAFAISAIALFPLGCNRSPEGGTPGTDNSFRLKGGTIPTSIKQGDSESVKVSIDRDRNFQQAVRLEAKAPAQVTASIDRNLVKAGESPDVNVQIKPKEDAAPGEYTVTVTGTPDSGSPTNLELKVTVTQR
jgi:uncharacterized membrane protein